MPGFVLLLTSLVAAGGPAPGGGSRSAAILVVVSQDAPPFAQAVEGLRAQIAGKGFTLDIVRLVGGAPDPAQVSAALARLRPRAVVTLGTRALEITAPRVGNVPIVAGMVLDPTVLRGLPNVTGVYLQYPAAVELEWLRKLVPSVRQVGVVYHSNASHARVEEARQAAAGLGLTIQAVRIEGPEQLPDALAGVSGRSDVLWGLVDPMVFNPGTVKPLMVFSFKHLVPLYGPSGAWVKAGALIAIERDYEDIGTQCGELLEKILTGTPASAITPLPPRRVRHVVNLRSAELLRRTLREDLVREGEMYR